MHAVNNGSGGARGAGAVEPQVAGPLYDGSGGRLAEEDGLAGPGDADEDGSDGGPVDEAGEVEVGAAGEGCGALTNEDGGGHHGEGDADAVRHEEEYGGAEGARAEDGHDGRDAVEGEAVEGAVDQDVGFHGHRLLLFTLCFAYFLLEVVAFGLLNAQDSNQDEGQSDCYVGAESNLREQPPRNKCFIFDYICCKAHRHR
jgi:hypothetical protein